MLGFQKFVLSPDTSLTPFSLLFPLLQEAASFFVYVFFIHGMIFLIKKTCNDLKNYVLIIFMQLYVFFIHSMIFLIKFSAF
jgi:hypothetical protein